jgi:hypothetical protein
MQERLAAKIDVKGVGIRQKKQMSYAILKTV